MKPLKENNQNRKVQGIALKDSNSNKIQAAIHLSVNKMMLRRRINMNFRLKDLLGPTFNLSTITAVPAEW